MRSILFSLVACATACSSPTRPPVPLTVPPLEAQVVEHAGTLLGGPSSRPVSWERGWVVRLSWYALSSMPGTLDPLAPHVRVIADLRGEDPLRAEAPWARGAVAGKGDVAKSFATKWSDAAAHRAIPLASCERLLPVDGTTGQRLQWTELLRDRDDFLREFAARGPLLRSMGAFVWSEDGNLRVALTSEDLDEAKQRRVRASQVAGEILAVRRDEVRRDVLVVDGTLDLSEGPWVAVLRSPILDSEAEAIGLVLSVEPADLGSLATADATWSPHSPESLATKLAPPPMEERAQRLALEAARDPALRRTALSYLAAAVGAALAEDAVLLGDDDLREELVSALPGADEPLEEMGWTFERAAWRGLIDRESDDALAPELRSCLLRHAGEAGNQPSLLAEFLAASADLDSFLARVLEENRLSLDDSHPAARVRAHDWLERQGITVPDYDPLGPRDARRAALAAHERAHLAAPAAPPLSPDATSTDTDTTTSS